MPYNLLFILRRTFVTYSAAPARGLSFVTYSAAPARGLSFVTYSAAPARGLSFAHPSLNLRSSFGETGGTSGTSGTGGTGESARRKGEVRTSQAIVGQVGWGRYLWRN